MAVYANIQAMSILPDSRDCFLVGKIAVKGELILAPMDGYSDLPFRSLARRLGSAMSYTEFISAIDVIHGRPGLERRLAYLEEERPVVVQLLDNDPERLLAAAQKLRSLNPDVIDINLGCSAKPVAGRGAGAGLLKEPLKIAQIFAMLNQTLDIPVSGKIRLGWDDQSRNYLQVAQIIEENGGSLIAVHGRTKTQAYTGNADWDAIAEIKQRVSIPVIANGDVQTVADIDRIKAHTGCDGVMIGRAAVANPWIFARKDREEITIPQVRGIIEEHLDASLRFYGAEAGLVFFRKYASRYMESYGISREQRQRLMTRPTSVEFLDTLDDIFKAMLE